MSPGSCRSPHGLGFVSSIVSKMRDFIFILILLAMSGSAIFHVSTEAWVALSIDLFVAFYAFRSWNPRKNFRR